MKKIIFILLSASLIVSIAMNIVLVTRLHKPNSIVGIYYNSDNRKTFEIIDDKNAMYGNAEATYTIDGNTLTFVYYTTIEPDGKSGVCTAFDSSKQKVVETDCRFKHEETAKIVDDGILYLGMLYSKID